MEARCAVATMLVDAKPGTFPGAGSRVEEETPRCLSYRTDVEPSGSGRCKTAARGRSRAGVVDGWTRWGVTFMVAIMAGAANDRRICQP